MSKTVEFEFSDTISGYVINRAPGARNFDMTTSDGRRFEVQLSATANAQIIRNLGEPYLDATGRLDDFLLPGQMVLIYGTFYPDASGLTFEAQTIYLPGKAQGKYRFEESDWWIKQAVAIGDFFIKAQFGDSGKYDYRGYRTVIDLTGKHTNTTRQEADTISRMVYGLASTYLLTGEDRFLDCAEQGVQYLRDHFRFYDTDENIIYWFHGIDVFGDDSEHKVFCSEFGDDYDAIPMYEQIYALAGPMQVFRINGDPLIRNDLNLTMDLFDRFFEDKEKGGHFSHIDPISLSPHAASLGSNRAKKNWNSVGDHAPAYLINAWLALEEERLGKLLINCADLICEHFPDYGTSPFVQERFFDDWSHDREWGWQQDRAVVGHNLKIAWNLMRVNSMIPKDNYVEIARKIADVMPQVGMDKQRFGWYDVMDRTSPPGKQHRFAWHDRKAWWQQEQGILAYQILHGCLQDTDHLKYGRESTAFYNAFFLDHNDGSVYFNVLNNGIPYLLGTERFKGSHSMSCYHSIELAYLSATYINLLQTHKTMYFHFKPHVKSFPSGLLRVSPDLLPPGSIKIGAVWVDGEPYMDFDAEKLTVTLPQVDHRPRIRVQIDPQGSVGK